jgi:hypothetical protein
MLAGADRWTHNLPIMTYEPCAGMDNLRAAAQRHPASRQAPVFGDIATCASALL